LETPHRDHAEPLRQPKAATVERHRQGRKQRLSPLGKLHQDMVRRAAIAIGENFCNDTLRLAIVALRAAIGSEADLLALLPAAPATPPRSVEGNRAEATHAGA
jgi:hypothetical protein